MQEEQESGYFARAASCARREETKRMSIEMDLSHSRISLTSSRTALAKYIPLNISL